MSTQAAFVDPGPLVFRLAILFANQDLINVQLYTETIAYSYAKKDRLLTEMFHREGAVELARDVLEMLRRNNFNMEAWQRFEICPIIMYRDGRVDICTVNGAKQWIPSLKLRWKP